MITWIAAAVLGATPVADEVVATWVHADNDARITINLEADGHCTIVSIRQFNGATYKSQCAYAMNGSTVRIITGDASGRREFSLVLDRRTDVMSMNDEDGAKFYRTRLDKQGD